MYMYFVLVVPFKGSSIWHQQKAKSHVHVTEMLMAHVGWVRGQGCSMPPKCSGYTHRQPPKRDRGFSLEQAEALYRELGIIIRISMHQFTQDVPKTN